MRQAVAALLAEDTSAIVTLKASGLNSPKLLDGKRYASYGARCLLILGHVIYKCPRTLFTTCCHASHCQFCDGVSGMTVPLPCTMQHPHAIYRCSGTKGALCSSSSRTPEEAESTKKFPCQL